MSQYEKMLNNKMDDEIKLAALEALVPEELEKRGCTSGSRDVRGGGVRFKNSRFQAE